MATKTNEIPRDLWDQYLSELGNRMREQPVRIEIEGKEIGDQVFANLPLVGISFEKKGSEGNAIEVTVGSTGRTITNATHLIESPVRVYEETTEDGKVECLDIEDADEVKTLVFFGSAAPTP